MGCALSKQFLQRKINPKQGGPTEKQQDEVKCKEGEVQSVLSETYDANNHQGETCDQNSLHQQPVNAGQSKDQFQESKHIDEQYLPPRTPTKQPTGLDDQNGSEYLYDSSLPNQPLFKDSSEGEDDKKHVHCGEPASSCPSYASPENEAQIRRKQVQNLQHQPDMLDTENEKQHQQDQICDQGLTFTPNNPRLSKLDKGSKPESISERRVPLRSSMSTNQKRDLGKEKQLEKEVYKEPSFQRNTSQHNELEKENNSSKMLDQQSPNQGSRCKWQNKELIQGNHSGITHEKITSSEPNTWQRNGPENKINSSEALGLEVSTQPDTLTGIQLPEAWVPMPNPEDSHHLEQLFPNSHEFEEVMKHLKSTIGKFEAEKIERVQNPELYNRYMRRKMEMSEINRETNEMHLFHAAGNGSMPAIMEHGFSRKSCSVQRKAYGRGLYFCKDACYSIGYTSSRDVRYLFLAQVLVGQYCQGNSLMILPPPKEPSIPECLYESVVDNTANPSIFVVFYGAQCYPEYLITIK